ncbi:hypothetical protein [Paraburkholderia sp. BR10882]|uniref:hypothetical protein n=1 Tax=unclassified Paraburkholderia TaxID=2615204 RepID=UPI0034CE1BA4
MNKLYWEINRLRRTEFIASTEDEQLAIQAVHEIHDWMQDNDMSTADLHLVRETDCAQVYLLSHGVFADKEEFDIQYRLRVECGNEVQAVAFKLRFYDQEE